MPKALQREVLVDNAATEAFAARMPQATHVRIADGRHELFRERDSIRDTVLAKMFEFLQSTAA
jgi:alpha-beta hydrolase superfamily lysophospholipase